MQVFKELYWPMCKNLAFYHILPLIIGMIILLFVLWVLQNTILSLPSRFRLTLKRFFIVVGIGPMLLFIINTCLFCFVSKFEHPSYLITLTIGAFIAGSILFAICIKPYIVFCETKLMYIFSIFVASLLILVASCALIWYFSLGSKINRHICETTVKSAGTLFAFFAGTATLIALGYTISSLHAQHTRISTYRQYLRESTFILDEYLDELWKKTDKIQEKITKKVSSKRRDLIGKTAEQKEKEKMLAAAKMQFSGNHSVRMLCFTPLNGNVTLGKDAPELIAYSKSLQKIRDVAQEGWVMCEIICLDDNATLYENDIKSLQIDTDKLLKAAKKECELARLYLGFSTQHDFNEEGDSLWEAYSESLEFIKELGDLVIPRQRDNLPTYHFMITKNRKKTVAIVGNPLRLPPPLKNSVLINQNNGKKQQNVEMIGFRTEEIHIVESLEETFSFYKEL